MLLRMIGFILLLSACERIPNWEGRRLLEEPRDELKSYEAVESRLWACRARLASNEETSWGRGLENFLEGFQEAGLSLVREASPKTLIGTAFYWEELELFLLSTEILQGATELECRQPESSWLKVRVLGQDQPSHLAVAEVAEEGADLKPKGSLRWRESPLRTREALTTFALPQRSLFVSDRVYAAGPKPLLQTGMDDDLRAFSPAVHSSFLGGLVLDQNARVVAWLNRVEEPLGLSFGLDREALLRLAQSLSEKGLVERPYWGFRIVFEEGEGFVVQEVEVGGIAHQAGLRVNDRLLEWNGKVLERFSDWRAEMGSGSEEAIILGYERAGRRYDARLKTN